MLERRREDELPCIFKLISPEHMTVSIKKEIKHLLIDRMRNALNPLPGDSKDGMTAIFHMTVISIRHLTMSHLI
jgi:hypothetical protein